MPKVSLGRGVLCVAAILGLQVFLMCLETIVKAFLMWLDKLPVGERRFVLVAVPLALIAGLFAHRLNEGGIR